jgi:hypothetical protein
MNRSCPWAGRSAVLAGVAASAALALAGCGGSSSSSSGGSGQQASGGSSSPSASGGSPAAAQGSGSGITTAAYFPVGTGDTWVYRQTLGVGGTGTTIDKMIAVKSVSAGEQATMTNTISYPVRKTTKETLVFLSDGSVEVPLTQFGSTTVSVKSGTVVWPSASALAAGQSHTSTVVMRLNEGGHSRTVTLPVTVKGEGSATVTVPAGTYHTSVINQIMTTSVDGYKFSIIVRTWVADGVGPVKSEAFTGLTSGSAPTSTEVLKSFTKG